MFKSRKEHLTDLVVLYAGAAATVIIMASVEQTDLTVLKFAVGSVGGCAAGFGIRE
jgi:hypothetical protein